MNRPLVPFNVPIGDLRSNIAWKHDLSHRAGVISVAYPRKGFLEDIQIWANSRMPPTLWSQASFTVTCGDTAIKCSASSGLLAWARVCLTRMSGTGKVMTSQSFICEIGCTGSASGDTTVYSIECLGPEEGE